VKVIVSPLCASNSASRKVPGPLSAALVTTIVFPFGFEVIVAVGTTGVNVDRSRVGVGVCATSVGVGDGFGPQPFKARESAIPRRSL